MYPVSDAFIKAIQSNSRSYFWTGEITTKKGQKYQFDNKDIVKGSGYITRQCCGNSEIELGTVYAAEMGISLFTDIDRYSLEDGTITLSFHLDLSLFSYNFYFKERDAYERILVHYSAYFHCIGRLAWIFSRWL